MGRIDHRLWHQPIPVSPDILQNAREIRTKLDAQGVAENIEVALDRRIRLDLRAVFTAPAALSGGGFAGGLLDGCAHRAVRIKSVSLGLLLLLRLLQFRHAV